MKPRSLNYKLGLNFLLITLFPLLLLGIGMFLFIASSVNDLLIEKNRYLIDAYSQDLMLILNSTEKHLNYIEALLEKYRVSERDIQENLDLIVENDPLISHIRLFNKELIITGSAPFSEDIVGTDVSGHSYIQNTLSHQRDFWQRQSITPRKDSWSETFLSPETGMPGVTVTRITREEGIIFYINLSFLSRLILTQPQNEEGFAFILDKKGVVIAHPNPLKVSHRENMRNVSIVRELMDTRRLLVKSTLTDNIILSVKAIPTTGWIIGFQQPHSAALPMIRYYRYTAYISGIISLLIASLLAYFTLKDTTTPISHLIAVIRKVSRGDYSTVNAESKILEVNDLSQQFNTMVNSIQERERELARLRNYLSDIINSMPSIVICVDSRGRVIFWNQAAEEITGIPGEEARNQKLPQVLPPLKDEMHDIFEAMNNRVALKDMKSTLFHEHSIKKANLTIYPLKAESSGGAVIRVDDVSEVARMEEILIQSEKMLSVGGLAAGMAHEINNPLAGMIQTAVILKNRLTNCSLTANISAAEEAGITMPAIEQFLQKRGIINMLNSINFSGKKAAEILSNMLSFVQSGQVRYQYCDPIQLMEESLTLAETDYTLKKIRKKSPFSFLREYQEDLPQLYCDGTRIKQALLNIIRNGADALSDISPELKKPLITLRMMREIKENFFKIEIEDNGPGMDELTRKRIFEPFFTTKSVQTGTGLGLSVAYFIITDTHKGELTVSSSPGAGTRFIIRLPIINEEPASD